MQRMMTRKSFSHTSILLVALILVALTACSPQQAILVYVTPTLHLPTDTPTAMPSVENPPTSTPNDPGTPSSTPLFLGPVVGADYTLQPTETPRPTRTPVVTAPPRPTNTPPGPSPTPTVTPTPLPQLNKQLIGVQVYNNYGPSEWDWYMSRTKEMNPGWVKVQANWSFLQPNGPNPDEQVLRTFELNLQSADRQGFKILLSVAKAPPWARPNGQADSPPDKPQALVDFLNLMFQNTKIGEVVDAIEIWNEPNLRREWNTNSLPFSGAGYMQLFKPAYDAIKAYRGDIIVVTAGLAPTGNTDGSIDDRTYLQQMYDNGLATYDAAIGIHPYGWGNPPDARCCDTTPERGWDDDPHFFFIETIDETRAIMNRNGDNDAQMWATEFGWAVWEDIGGAVPEPESSNLWMAYNTLQQQADYTLRAFEIAQQRGDMGPMFLWNLNYANEFTIANRQEIIAYSLLFPPRDGSNDIYRRPLFYLLPLTVQGQ